jgi:hypothetical protein
MTGFGGSDVVARILGEQNTYRKNQKKLQSEETTQYSTTNPFVYNFGGALESLQEIETSVFEEIAKANALIEEFEKAEQARSKQQEGPLAELRPVEKEVHQEISKSNSLMVKLGSNTETSEKVQKLALVIKDAMDGWGSNKETIFNILSNLNHLERAELERTYGDMFSNGDRTALRKRLRKEFNSHNETKAFDYLNENLAKTDPIQAAVALKEAMKGMGTDTRSCMQIFSSADDVSLLEIENAFDMMEGKAGALRKWLKSDFRFSGKDDFITRLNNAAMK